MVLFSLKLSNTSCRWRKGRKEASLLEFLCFSTCGGRQPQAHPRKCHLELIPNLKTSRQKDAEFSCVDLENWWKISTA